MKEILTLKSLAIGLTLALALQSCSENEAYDVIGSKENKVYLNTQSWGPVSAPKNTFYFDITNTPEGSIIADHEKVEVKFGALCVHPAENDIVVKFDIDNSLISEEFSPLPENVTLTFDKKAVTIPKGATKSTDSITVSIETEDLLLLEANSYLIPVKIIEVSNTGLSKNLTAAYVALKTTETNCYERPTQDDMVGQIVDDRSAWTATLNMTPSSGDLSRMFNGNTRSYWYVSPAKVCEVTVDLGSELTEITGIRVHSYSRSYAISAANVYSSIDGQNWISQGAAQLSTQETYQYVKFYNSIEARYIRLEVTGWNNPSYVIMAEFDVYTN